MSKDEEYRERLTYTQDLRRKLLDNLTKNGEHLTQDPKELKAITSLLKDMDSTTINDRKLDVDEEANDTSRIAHEAALEMLYQAQNKNPFERAPDGSAPERVQPPTASDELLGEHEFADGEGEIGISEETSGDFQKRVAEGSDPDEYT